MDILISAVNEADLGWKADVCKYQAHHAKYGSHCKRELLLAQTAGEGDGEEAKEPEAKKFGDTKDPAFVKALGKA